MQEEEGKQQEEEGKSVCIILMLLRMEAANAASVQTFLRAMTSGLGLQRKEEQERWRASAEMTTDGPHDGWC